MSTSPVHTPDMDEKSGRFQAQLRNLRSNSLLTGSAILFVSTTVVNLGNYVFNLAMGRWLGPATFADLSLIVTLMLVVTLVTGTFQTVVAKFSAAFAVDEDLVGLAGLRRWSSHIAWGLGTVLAIGFVVGASWLQAFFHTASHWPFIIFGIGVPIYFAQGVDRGILQGRLLFGTLTWSYQAEMWARLVAGVALVAAGFGVNGAVGALTLSFVATWLVARRAAHTLPRDAEYDVARRRQTLRFAGPVALALVGQILINNSDVLIVKRFFVSEEAGLYAALALIGRIVFFATWSVATVLLPTVAQRHQRGERHIHLLWLSLGLVMAVSSVIIVGSYFFAEPIVNLLFGAAYVSISPLLWLYAIATTLYALSNVIVTYRLSIGNGWGSLFSVIGGVIQVIVLSLYHESLAQVVIMQIYLMSGLFAVLMIWELWLQHRESGKH